MDVLTCAACGSALPEGAMFCGECGRAVAPAAVAARRVPRAPVPEVRPATETLSTPGAWHWGAEPVLVDDSRSAAQPEDAAAEKAAVEEQPGEEPLDEAPLDEAPLEELPVDEPEEVAAEPAAVEESLPEAPVAEPVGERQPVAAALPEPQLAASPLRCEQCGAALAADDIFCGECGHVSRAASEGFGTARDTQVIERLEADLPPRRLPPEQLIPMAEPEDVEATRIVSRGQIGARFVLQFSTGESSTVFGSGLIGRNPRPEPGEFFDQLVRVLDPSRSVSKSHLEFGQESGAFWVLDRFSGNGTILREPDAEAIRCVPGRRYLVVRGTRIEIGEQFFIVS